MKYSVKTYFFIYVFCISANLIGQNTFSFIVQIEKDVTIEKWTNEIKEIINIVQVKALNKELNIYLLEILDIKSSLKKDVFDIIKNSKGISNIQYDEKVEFRNNPNDYHYNKQWNLSQINCQSVWNKSTGSLTANGDTIVVAILDAGFDVNHLDLKNNIWRNNGEIPNDQIDNDLNGYIDDINGWNFKNNSNKHVLDNHGTSVAGIIGAEGNNDIGITGINWRVKMLLCSVNKVSEIIEAYTYIINQRKLFNSSNGKKGALIVVSNASLGISYIFCKDQPIWGSMFDAMGEVGILSSTSVTNNHIDVDQFGDMPTTCKSPFLITVLASDLDNNIVSTSGFGSISVDIGAPGINVFTTISNNQYGFFNGTSASAPQISAAIALLYCNDCLNFSDNIKRLPKQTALTIKNAILKGVDLMPQNDSIKYSSTNGILNIEKSLSVLNDECGLKSQNKIEILKLFPNPIHKGIEIEYLASNQNSVSISIINLDGKVVYSEKLPLLNTWVSKRHYIDVQNLSAGIYWISLNNGQTNSSKIFVIAK
ncbi:MAG: S8 family serine peptidase [Bacteroidota bacterium]|nr:S8 family serine peptidase [Bacteroidota bacterium]